MAKKHLKILVVDDEPDITSSFQSFFGRRGFSVSTTASGKDALEIITTLNPDLVFLDLTLPEISGKTVLRRLREFDKKTKVIIVTGHALESQLEDQEFQSLGVSAYLNKPLKLEELEGIAAAVLKNECSIKDTEKYKLIKPDPSLSTSEIVHRLKNILGNMRSTCEVFLLNKRDGIYDDKTDGELNGMSEEIIRDVVQTVDRVMVVIKDIKNKNI